MRFKITDFVCFCTFTGPVLIFPLGTRFGPPSVAPSMRRAFYWVTPLSVDPLFRCLLPIMASKKMSNKCKFEEGEKVLCYEPNPLKTKVLYDSKVNDNILPLFRVSFATFQWTVFVFIFCLGFKSGARKRWPRTPNILQVSHPFSSECKMMNIQRVWYAVFMNSFFRDGILRGIVTWPMSSYWKTPKKIANFKKNWLRKPSWLRKNLHVRLLHRLLKIDDFVSVADICTEKNGRKEWGNQILDSRHQVSCLKILQMKQVQ